MTTESYLTKPHAHVMVFRDWEKMTGHCVTHGPDTPMTSKGLCQPAKEDRRAARRASRSKGINQPKAKPVRGRGRQYKSDAGNVVLPFTVIQEMHAQNPNCQICGVDFSTMDMSKRDLRHIDHCHTTGKIRGVLCHHCNRMLGGARDNPETLAKAIEYLSR